MRSMKSWSAHASRMHTVRVLQSHTMVIQHLIMGGTSVRELRFVGNGLCAELLEDAGYLTLADMRQSYALDGARAIQAAVDDTSAMKMRVALRSMQMPHRPTCPNRCSAGGVFPFHYTHSGSVHYTVACVYARCRGPGCSGYTACAGCSGCIDITAGHAGLGWCMHARSRFCRCSGCSNTPK